MTKQEDIWQKHAKKIQVSGIVQSYHNPSPFQIELAEVINKICKENNYSKVIEVGCESGITSMLLHSSLKKTFLDLNASVLEKVKLACAELNISADFLAEDMYSMSCKDETYDLVFNAGVIEHFDEQERIKILKEYSRILKADGTMVISIPNHYSFPYRSAYILKKKILRGYKWPWPEEHKILDLSKEINENGLLLSKRTTLAKDTIFNFWRFIRPVKWLMMLSDYLFNYEGYLTTLVIKKRDAVRNYK